MSEKTKQIVQMIDMLPDSDKELAYEIIKKLVFAWDPDFTKVTDKERNDIEAAEQSGFVDESNIDWDNLSAFA
ncbi:MAG: hypothetical protein ACI4II_07815 [Acutalibacteraceae bacterium]